MQSPNAFQPLARGRGRHAAAAARVALAVERGLFEPLEHRQLLSTSTSGGTPSFVTVSPAGMIMLPSLNRDLTSQSASSSGDNSGSGSGSASQAAGRYVGTLTFSDVPAGLIGSGSGSGSG